ncbi:MAG: S24 family peptidase [Acidobacteria bacterium]|nr:S24 family peptidase [Acidobacteriota bacterium]
MAASPVVSTRTGEWSLVEVALPDTSPIAGGVLLLDPAEDKLYPRFRRDWREIVENALDLELLAALEDDLRAKAEELGGEGLLRRLEDTLSDTLLLSDRRPVVLHRIESTLKQLYRAHVAPLVLPFRTHLPVYTLVAAAGKFGDAMEVEPEGWEEVRNVRPAEGMFLAHVAGRSMEPLIPEGSLCVFRRGPAGSRQGRRVLVENFGEPGENRYTVKVYESEKRATGEDTWEHTRIVMKPLNPAYAAWELQPGDFRVLAEFVAVAE